MINTTLVWHFCKDELPKEDGEYLVAMKYKYGNRLLYFHDLEFVVGEGAGWNCTRYLVSGEINNEHNLNDDVVAWAEYKEAMNFVEEEWKRVGYGIKNN